MDLKIVDPTEFPNWDSLVVFLSDYSFFYSSAWAKVLMEAYRYKPLYFCALEDERLCALLPVMEVSSFITGKRGVSLPFTDRCEPFVNDQVQFDALLAHAKEYGKPKGWSHFELRGGMPFLTGVSPSVSFLGHTLDLEIGEGRLFSDLRDSTKRNITKAEKEGVEIVISETMDAIETFYKLNRLTRKQHGLPPQPFSFFKAVHEHVLSNGLGFVVIALYQSEPVAAAVFFHLGRKALFKYGASDLEHQSLRANNLVMWKAIERLSKDNFESLCFGRTDEGHEGLRQFKKGWGVKEYPINYYRYDLRQNKYMTDRHRKNRYGNKIFSKLPIPMLNLIGSLAYRHMG